MARPRQVSDEEILSAAREAILENGPSVSTTVIARMVGLSQAALFKRFGTKAQLVFQALGMPLRPPWCELLEAGPDERPVVEQLVEAGDVILGFFHRMVPRMIALRSYGVQIENVIGKVAPSPPAAGKQALTAWFERAMEHGLIRPADPEVLAISFLGNFQARVFWKHIMGDPMVNVPDDVYVRQVTENFWRGVAPQEAS